MPRHRGPRTSGLVWFLAGLLILVVLIAILWGITLDGPPN